MLYVDEKIKNIELKLKLEKERNIQEPKRCSIENMMADICIFSKNEMNGSIDPELQELYSKMQENFVLSDKAKITDEYIKQIADDRINGDKPNSLIQVDNKKIGLFFRNRKK